MSDVHDAKDGGERYQRQQMIHWLDQQRLQNMTVAVLGAGAVGNEVIKNLALLGVGQIDVFDFDRIEIHNLTRSVLFRETDVGQSKAAVAAQRGHDINPDLSFNPVEGDLWDRLNVAKTAGYDTVFGCVDNFEARMRASYLSRLAGVDFISAGIDSRYASVQWHRFSRLHGDAGMGVACYECDMGEAAYQAVSQRYSCGWLRKVADESKLVPTTTITASIAAAHAVSQCLTAQSGVDGITPADAAGRLLIDTHGGHTSKSVLPVNDQCFACAGLSARVIRGQFDGTLDSLRQNWSSGIELDRDRRHIDLSEALILSCRCVNDDDHARTLDLNTRLKPARNYSDAISWCSTCGESSIDVDIAESLSVQDWKQQFDGDRLGCQFVKVDDDGTTHACDIINDDLREA